MVSVFTTITLTTTLIAFTPLKELIPGYASSKLRREAIELALKTDSLELVLEQNEHYLGGVQRILQGEIIDSVLVDLSSQDSSQVEIILSNPSTQDSVFREWVEEENAFTLSQKAPKLSIPQLMSPLDGMVTSSFDKACLLYTSDAADE